MKNRTGNRYSLRRFKLGTLVRLFRRFAPHLRCHRRKLAGAGVCVIGVTAMELLRPWPIKVVFDAILVPQEAAGAVVGQVNAISTDTDVLLALVALSILAIAIFTGLFGFGQSYLLAATGQKVVASIRQELYGHIQRLSHSFHDEHSTGDLLLRLNGDVHLMRDLLVTSAIFVGSRILLIVATITIMAWMDWRLTLVALAILPMLAMAVTRFGKEIKGASRRQRRKESKISQVMTERISAITVVQAHAREAHEDERFSRQNTSSAKAGVRATRLEAHLDRLVQVILAFGTAGVIWYGVVRVRAGAITPGDLLVFSAYLAGLYKPVRRLAALTGRIVKSSVCGERILAILDLEPEIRDLPDARPAPAFAGAIELDAVRFDYGRGATVLGGVDLRIEPGQTLALIGRSGSGKSTVANLLLRFYDPQAGCVRIDGLDIRRYTLNSLRDQIAIVLQDSVLFNTSIAENISYGKLDATREEIVEAATQANANDFIERLPNGYDTVIAERGATLSGGQRQRIAIARAIVRDAPIVILDEPTTGLDDANEGSVREALARLVRHRTCVLITHDLELAASADRVIEVAGGALEELRPDRVASTAAPSRPGFREPAPRAASA
jgi:ABC-type multidrug transport system fused ATPase/permease subunit